MLKWVFAGIQQYSIAGGTLKGHLIAGEERFAVEWNKDDDSVWYVYGL